MSDPQRNELTDNSGTALQGRSFGDVHIGAPKPPPPPRQAPKADRRFTNRAEDLVRLESLAGDVARDRRGCVALLLGQADIGKSATLAEAADRISGYFADGVLHRDLTQWRDREGNLDVAGVLRGLLYDLHVRDADQESDVRALTGRLRGVTAGKSLLLLLDDVASDSELDQFPLGSGPHLVLAACAQGFGGAGDAIAQGAEALTLRALADEDSLRLFRSFHAVDQRLSDRREYASATQLVRLCGGLPSTIRMAAGHVNAQDLSVTELVAAVRSRQRSSVPPLSGAEAVIDVALSGLGSDGLRLLEFFSVCPGRSIPDELGRSALGDRAPEVIARLADASLLHPATGNGRGMVELVRSRVREGTAERWRFGAAAVLRFFTVTHHLADRVGLGERHRLTTDLNTAELTTAPADYRPPFTTRREAADWQDQYLAHVPELMRMAYEIGNPVAVLVLADAVWPVCHGRRRLEIGTRIYEFALKVARQADHRSAVVRCAVYLARILTELGSAERAAALVAEAAEAAEGTELDRAVVLETEGLLRERFPDLRGSSQATSGELLTRSRDIHRRLGRPRGDALQTYQLGNGARDRGDLATAEAELREAERLAENRLSELSRVPDRSDRRWLIDDWRLLLAKVRLSLARVLIDRGRCDQAEAAADGAMMVFDEFAEPVKQVQAARLLARIARERGEGGQARAWLVWAGQVAEYYHLEGDVRKIAAELAEVPGKR
ncbi:tetratricopeptide repeat protein [Nocardiopsis oceani]